MAIQPSSSSSSTTTDPTHPLTFPPTHFAKLAPRSYLHAHLSSPSPLRPSRRLPHESRKISINTGSLTHCHGSAVVRSGDTAVVCGVRGEILNVEDVVDYKSATTNEELNRRYGGEGVKSNAIAAGEFGGGEESRRRHASRDEAEEMAELNLVVPNVELSTGCSPGHLPGGPPSEEAQGLSHRVLSLLHTTQLLSMHDLRIWYNPGAQFDTPRPPAEAAGVEATSMSLETPSSRPKDDVAEEEEEEETQRPAVKAYWTLHITLLVLSLSGPPFATLWTALVAALRNTRLPRAWWDADLNSVLCSPTISEAETLRLNGLPMAMGFGVFEAERDGAGLVASREGEGGEGEEEKKKKKKSWILADMDGFEASCCGEEVTVVVREREGERGTMEVLRIEKGGGGVVGKGEMREVVRLAGERWREWREVVEGALIGVEVQ